VVFPARVFHVKSRVSCGLIPLLVVVYSPSFITDEGGKLVETRAAMSWNDYYCKKDVTGVTYAKKLKREFWVIKLTLLYLFLLYY
jgi:hypothetical protein